MGEQTLQKLIADLQDAVTFKHDSDADGYSQSADAMWQAALAAFNWAADEVGSTGFQASWAALRFYGEAMHVTCPFMVVRIEDALYPQYDIPGRLATWLEENRGWLGDEAKKELDAYEADPVHTYVDDDGVEQSVATAHPNVVEHWRKLIEAAA